MERVNQHNQNQQIRNAITMDIQTITCCNTNYFIEKVWNIFHPKLVKQVKLIENEDVEMMEEQPVIATLIDL